jgi:hypothetical protein
VTRIIKYGNGLEAMFLADGYVFQALTGGPTATIQIVSGTPRFEFPLARAAAAAAEAQRQCTSTDDQSVTPWSAQEEQQK